MTLQEVLTLKSIGFFTPILQILTICILFVATIVVQLKEYKKTGKLWGKYPLRTSIFFVPIYEEVIFRGIILVGLMSTFTVLEAAIISSLLFGLWHFKNIVYHPVAFQTFYAGFIFGPIVTFVTLWSGTIWLAVIIHFLNNLISPLFQLIKNTYGNHR